MLSPKIDKLIIDIFIEDSCEEVSTGNLTFDKLMNYTQSSCKNDFQEQYK